MHNIWFPCFDFCFFIEEAGLVMELMLRSLVLIVAPWIPTVVIVIKYHLKNGAFLDLELFRDLLLNRV